MTSDYQELAVKDNPTRNDQERELISRILAGAKDEYRHLVVAYQGQVYAMIVRQVGSIQIANELTQDTFLKAFLNLSKFRFESAFSTWLTRIALNITSSYFNSRRHKQRTNTVALDLQHYEQQESLSNCDGYDEKALARLRDAVSLLKPKFREVIILCALEQKSYKEAAEILEIPVGTIRSRLNKARLLLREKYFEA